MRLLLPLIFISCLTPNIHADSSCPQKLRLAARTLEQAIVFASKISLKVKNKVEVSNIALREKRGYAILIGTMVGTAAATTYLTTHLPENFTFLSSLIGQMSTLGVFVFGSPIWEPLTSAFRKLAFGVNQSPDQRLSTRDENERHEATWLRTQENYSHNSQMSRNVVNQFIASTKQNFYEAFRAMNSSQSSYAVDQVAEAAIRLKSLFKDIEPEDRDVRIAVLTAFSSHIQELAFQSLVLARIQELEPTALEGENRIYYQRVLTAWFH